MSKKREITVIVPINIALIKYWGKRDEELILPLNDSLSITVDGLYAETRVEVIEVEVDPHQQDEGGTSEDSVTLNGQQLTLKEKPRFAKCFDEIRRIIKTKQRPDFQGSYKFDIQSETNFPVGAGLASSAAGFAAIAYAIGRLFDLPIEEICRTARLGSGSACRSVYDGLVRWNAGVDPSGADCNCTLVASVDHWPNLMAVIAVVSSEAKMHGSTEGMRRTVATSSLLKHRVEVDVPRHKAMVEQAYKERNFALFAEFVMKDSNQLHAVCLDTFPPLMFLSDSSRKLINFVHRLNDAVGRPVAAYTFDAGANCCLFVERENVNALLSCLCHYFPNKAQEKFIRGCSGLDHSEKNRITIDGLKHSPDAIEYIIVSSVGGGPKVVG